MNDGMPGVEVEDFDVDDNDPSSLFIPEGPPIPLSIVHRQNTTPAPRQTLPQKNNSVYNIVRKAQQKRLAQNMATSRPAVTLPKNANPDPEAYLEAITHRPSSSTSVPPFDEAGDNGDKRAAREFLKQKRMHDDLKRKRGGTLLFQEDVEWMRIKGAEEARKRKRARDLAKAQEDNQEDPGLFPTISPVPDNEEEEEDRDDGSEFRKRPRPSPDSAQNLTTMVDAELASMRVAMEAQADEPQKKKKKGAAVDDGFQASTPSGRTKGNSTGKFTKTKAAPKKVTNSNGGRESAKKKREVARAVKQATSLFTSNVFQQQAGADAAEQPTFRSGIKANALKELIASLPIEADQKQARTDMNILLEATREFDGKGSVKSDKRGGWLVKGMKTSLKAYQVLGSAFMRRRENALEEPKGGLVADQMGLGKTLMMLG